MKSLSLAELGRLDAEGRRTFRAAEEPTVKRRITVEVDESDLDALAVGATLRVEVVEHPTRGTGYGSWFLTVVGHDDHAPTVN